MKKTFFKALAVSTLLVASMSTVVSASVKDSTYSFYVNTGDSRGVYLSPREKEDASSTYVNITSTPSKYLYCMVQGYRPASTTFVWADETVGGAVKLTLGQQLIRQYVYEHGGRMARLHFSDVADKYGLVQGKWSPDSVGSFRVVN